MKTFKLAVVVLASLLSSLSSTQAQAPVINSFSQNGILVCTNLLPGTVASVEWASSLSGPWTNNWAGLDAVTVNSNTTISVSVPMFYRVRGVSPFIVNNGMALIPAGSFTMGDTWDGESDAIPTNVYVSAFYMDTNLVSGSQWQSVVDWGTSHGYDTYRGSGKAENHPAVGMNWYDCMKWCNARSQQAGLTPVYYTDAGLTQVYTNSEGPPFGSISVYANWTANGYRLPTEAEWEKAARGGLSGQRFPWGNTISESQANYFAYPNPPNDYGFAYDLGPYSGYNTNFNESEPYTSPVGYFAANGYGLRDMAGNVLERCWDWYGTPYGQPTTNNPTGPAGPPVFGNYRVVRGGCWGYNASSSQCAMRSSNDQADSSITTHYIGFRCVRRQ